MDHGDEMDDGRVYGGDIVRFFCIVAVTYCDLFTYTKSLHYVLFTYIHICTHTLREKYTNVIGIYTHVTLMNNSLNLYFLPRDTHDEIVRIGVLITFSLTSFRRLP